MGEGGMEDGRGMNGGREGGMKNGKGREGGIKREGCSESISSYHYNSLNYMDINMIHDIMALADTVNEY